MALAPAAVDGEMEVEAGAAAAVCAVATATLSAATIRDAGSEAVVATAAGAPSAGALSEPLARESEPDASASVCLPPFVEVCLLWPSASAVRATWVDRTLANASVGGAPGGGLVPRASAVGGEPEASGAPSAPALPGPAPGAPAGAPEGASAATTGISDADPMPGLMLPSGGSC